MVSEQSNNETLENNLGETQIKTEPVTVAAAAMEKLLQNLQKSSIYQTGVVSQPYVQSSDQKMPHVPLLSDAWAHVLSPFHLTAQPIPFYASSDVQQSNPSSHPHPHAPSMNSEQQPSIVNLSNLYRGESSTHSKPTESPVYSKNPVTSFPNLPSNYITGSLDSSTRNFSGLNPKFDIVCGRILGQRPLPSLMEVFEARLEEDRTNAMGVLTTPTIDSVAFSARSSNHDSDKIMESQFLCASTARNNGTPRINVRNSTVVPQESGMPQSLGLISVDGNNPWILDSRATEHLTGDFTSLMMIPSAVVYLGSVYCHPTLALMNKTVTTSSGKWWFVTFIDDHTRLTWVYLITDKSETPLDFLKKSYPSTCLVSEVPFRVFGCTAYVHNFGPNHTKFTPRAQACVFVEYPLHQRGYKCFHPPSRKYFVAMDITFCENRPYFPVSHLQGESMSEKSKSTFEFIEPTPSTVSDVDPRPIILPTNQVPWKTYYRRNLIKEVGSPTSQPPTPVQDFEPPRNQAEQSHTRKLDEYDLSLDIPFALTKEMKALEKNRTWEICALSNRHKTIGCKWVFSLKYKADETFSSVAKLNTVRVLLFVAVNKD
ncbi:reverse transcriptase [Cucumis melo var. makuwa]|uniref:Reverse transcriptase n=1 Tax=Cucumis melo var. makuwa TaxID=1194695 RepID=A0A5D3BU93_CUCMM|nr:reverse transcriptase [Cucumis melo var. makuwa]TYK02700.1 reverse transcriptase [Cucumis melo var. makuwa]